MEPFVARLVQGTCRTGRASASSRRPRLRQQTDRRLDSSCSNHLNAASYSASRCFTGSSYRTIEQRKSHSVEPTESSYAQPAHKVSQNVTQDEKDHYNKLVEHSKEQQTRKPWMREGSDMPPVSRPRSAGAMTKGKLLTTPSRMLKLILPLVVKDVNNDRKEVEPLALLVHPQQPLSYLERLIQSEIPTIKSGNTEKIPAIHFRAEDSAEDQINPDKASSQDPDRLPNEDEVDDEDGDAIRVEGRIQRTGKINKKSSGAKKNEPREPQPKDMSHPNFVRWSPSTEIGDFIRDASRGKEFSVEIEGSPEPIYVGVPSFEDRTYYLRMRLRKTAKKISNMADIKKECDDIAHRSAQRFAKMGFGILVGWWYVVYRLTFETDLGWDTMEPVTYLVGLSTLIGGYCWFLYHNRSISYQSAMAFTISRRQSKLYEAKGFDINAWEGLVEEGNRLRREIKLVADEYDQEWDEKQEAGDEKVANALRDDRKKKKKDKDDDGDLSAEEEENTRSKPKDDN